MRPLIRHLVLLTVATAVLGSCTSGEETDLSVDDPPATARGDGSSDDEPGDAVAGEPALPVEPRAATRSWRRRRSGSPDRAPPR